MNIYLKIINLVKFNYEFTARYLPALIFTITIILCLLKSQYIILELGFFDFLKLPLVISTSLIITVIPKIIATSISGFIQESYWKKYGNSIINYLNNSNNDIYKRLLTLFNSDNELISDLLKKTRNDKKLLSKNIFYGFCRNSLFLIFIFLIINLIYFNYLIILNFFIFVFCILMVYISSQRYIEQLLKSYIEKESNYE